MGLCQERVVGGSLQARTAPADIAAASCKAYLRLQAPSLLAAVQQPGAAVTRATAHVSLRSNGGGGSKNSSRGENQDDGKEGGQPVCSDALWKLAKQAPDLQTLVAVQRLTTLNFFTPFGKSSRRHFTLFAPTDAAFFTLFSEPCCNCRAGERHLDCGCVPLFWLHACWPAPTCRPAGCCCLERMPMYIERVLRGAAAAPLLGLT